MKKLTQSV